MAAPLLLYCGLRCALLLTLENSELDGTPELFPVLFVASASLYSRNPRTGLKVQ